MHFAVFSALVLAGGVIACSSSEASVGQAAPDPSEPLDPAVPAVFQEPLADGNSFTCATCHAVREPSGDRLRRPGHPLGDATRRSSWKNGKSKTFLDAVNTCVTEWMVADAWLPTDPRFIALRDYLDSQAPRGAANDLAFEVVQPPSEIGGGDEARGRRLFDVSCVVCHGAGGLGTARGPRVAGSLRAPAYVAARIRTSGSSASSVYEGLTGGVMPFWAKDRLSDAEVRDLVAFVTATPASASGGAGGAGGAGGQIGSGETGGSSGAEGGGPQVGGSAGAPPEPECTKQHPRVGWSADLGVNLGEGQVSGQVTMVDDCTLELRDFSYDGNGIDVRVYGSGSPTFRPGFIMGDDLVGRVFTKQTLRVKLPAGQTLDSLNWVSIWCVPASANFGSGPFLPPQ